MQSPFDVLTGAQPVRFEVHALAEVNARLMPAQGYTVTAVPLRVDDREVRPNRVLPFIDQLKGLLRPKLLAQTDLPISQAQFFRLPVVAYLFLFFLLLCLLFGHLLASFRLFYLLLHPQYRDGLPLVFFLLSSDALVPGQFRRRLGFKNHQIAVLLPKLVHVAVELP